LLDTLIRQPFNLILDESIQIKVQATNYYGASDLSVAGNGARVRLVPDAPVNLSNDLTVTNGAVIRFTWQEGASNGGAPVIDYDVVYD